MGSTPMWPPDVTQALLNIWAEQDVQEMLASSYRNRDVFMDITQRLNNIVDADYTWVQCRNKVKLLKVEYRKAKKYPGNVRARFPHFDFMDAVLGEGVEGDGPEEEGDRLDRGTSTTSSSSQVLGPVHVTSQRGAGSNTAVKPTTYTEAHGYQEMSFGNQSVGFNGNHGHLAPSFQSVPKKRRLEDGWMEMDFKENKAGTRCSTPSALQVPPPVRRFLSLPGNVGIYHTEEWKNDRSHTFLPITQDTLVNTRHVEQISFSDGRFFLGNEAGSYCDTQDGAVIHMWRFDNEHRRSYISRSFLFLDKQMYYSVRQQLEEL